MQSVVREWSDRRKKMVVPLFPNYVFVRLSAVQRHLVLSIAGVTRFVSFCGSPARLSDEEMIVLKTFSEGKMNVDKEEFYSVGDKVKVVSGALAGMEGMLIERKGNQRFLVRFNSIEQAVSVQISQDVIDKIEEFELQATP
jgi:transcription antitermination factor NusG